MPSTTREIRALTSLALPIIATNLGQMAMGVVDTLMVGRVDKEALAAVTLGNVWINGTMMFAMGIVFGMDPVVTQAHGAKDRERGALVLQRGIVVALGVGIVLALSWIFTERFLVAMGQDPVIAAEAHRYTWVQSPSIPLFMVFVALRQSLQGRGILAPTLIVMVSANVFNVVANWALIFGHMGFPALGAEGAGIATAATRAVMFVALVATVMFWRLHAEAWVPWSRRALVPAGWLEILRYGVPVAFQLGLEIWAFAGATLMAGMLGTLDVAAHAIVLNMASVSFMVPLGISLGAVTRVGNLIGASEPDQAQRSAWVAFGMGAGVMLVFGALFAGLRDWLPTLYTDEREVVLACAAILPIAAAFQVFDGIQVVGSGILRGMGQIVPAAVFNLIGYWVFALPLAWWMAFGRESGLAGVWWGLALGLAAVAFMMLWWVQRRGPSRVHARIASLSAP